MSRYIDAELLNYRPYKEKFPLFDRAEPFIYITHKLIVFKEDIDAIPTADVQEIKHGQWLNNKSEIATDFECPVWCSVCAHWANTQTPHCPNCGAKMDEGSEE